MPYEYCGRDARNTRRNNAGMSSSSGGSGGGGGGGALPPPPELDLLRSSSGGDGLGVGGVGAFSYFHNTYQHTQTPSSASSHYYSSSPSSLVPSPMSHQTSSSIPSPIRGVLGGIAAADGQPPPTPGKRPIAGTARAIASAACLPSHHQQQSRREGRQQSIYASSAPLLGQQLSTNPTLPPPPPSNQRMNNTNGTNASANMMGCRRVSFAASPQAMAQPPASALPPAPWRDSAAATATDATDAVVNGFIRPSPTYRRPFAHKGDDLFGGGGDGDVADGGGRSHACVGPSSSLMMASPARPSHASAAGARPSGYADGDSADDKTDYDDHHDDDDYDDGDGDGGGGLSASSSSFAEGMGQDGYAGAVRHRKHLSYPEGGPDSNTAAVMRERQARAELRRRQRRGVGVGGVGGGKGAAPLRFNTTTIKHQQQSDYDHRRQRPSALSSYLPPRNRSNGKGPSSSLSSLPSSLGRVVFEWLAALALWAFHWLAYGVEGCLIYVGEMDIIRQQQNQQRQHHRTHHHHHSIDSTNAKGAASSSSMLSLSPLLSSSLVMLPSPMAGCNGGKDSSTFPSNNNNHISNTNKSLRLPLPRALLRRQQANNHPATPCSSPTRVVQWFAATPGDPSTCFSVSSPITVPPPIRKEENTFTNPIVPPLRIPSNLAATGGRRGISTTATASDGSSSVTSTTTTTTTSSSSSCLYPPASADSPGTMSPAEDFAASFSFASSSHHLLFGGAHSKTGRRSSPLFLPTSSPESPLLPPTLKQLPHAYVYNGPYAVIANRPRRFIDRLLYRPQKQPWTKGYALLLVLLEVFVLWQSRSSSASPWGCWWWARGYSSDSSSSFNSNSAHYSLFVKGAYQTMPRATPLADAAFSAQCMCFIIARVLFYLFYENFAVAGLAAFVHFISIFHFWSMWGISNNTATLAAAAASSTSSTGGGLMMGAVVGSGFFWWLCQWLAFAIVVANAALFASHLRSIADYYFNCKSAAQRAMLEEMAMSSTESLHRALKRQSKRRARRRRGGGGGGGDTDAGAATAAEADDLSSSSLVEEEASASSPIGNASSSCSVSSPTDLYYRDRRPISERLYRRIRAMRWVCKYVGALGWNALIAIGALETAGHLLIWGGEGGGGRLYHQYGDRRYSSLPSFSVTAADVHPYFFRSLFSPDASQIVIFISLFTAAASILSMLVPFHKKVALFRVNRMGRSAGADGGHDGGTAPSSSPPVAGKYATQSYFDDSEDDELYVSAPVPRLSVVAARLPVALIGIAVQVLIAYPMRSAAIAEAAAAAAASGDVRGGAGGGGYYYGYSTSTSSSSFGGIINDDGPNTMMGGGCPPSSSPVTLVTPFPLLYALLSHLFALLDGGASFLVHASGLAAFLTSTWLLSVCSLLYTVVYVGMLLGASGAMTPVWTKMLDHVMAAMDP